MYMHMYRGTKTARLAQCISSPIPKRGTKTARCAQFIPGPMSGRGTETSQFAQHAQKSERAQISDETK